MKTALALLVLSTVSCGGAPGVAETELQSSSKSNAVAIGGGTQDGMGSMTSPGDAPTTGGEFDSTLRVMTYNIWVGGTQHQPIEKTIEAIAAADADIVGLQELSNQANLQTIADGLGFYFDWSSGFVSRYPISDSIKFPRARWGGAVVTLPDGQEIVVLNTHLTAYPYGPYEIRDGNATNEKAAGQVEEDSGRLPEVRDALATYKEEFDQDLPAFFTGDFNTPSHLDWTARTRERTFGMAVNWPVTVTALRAGFRDAFRVAHPDETTVPGYTWSPGYPVGNIAADDVMDRIDLVLYRGEEVEVVSAEVVGETGPITDIAVDPWPSDHRAVVIEFRLPSP